MLTEATPSSSSRRAWAVLAVAGLLGCGEPLPEVTAVGDRVRIAPLDDVRVCAGTVQTFEQYLAEVEARLGVTRPGPVTFYWSPRATEEFCSGGQVEACAATEEGWIAGGLGEFPHELVHHVAFASRGSSTLLLEEGVAVYASGGCVRQQGRAEERPTLASLLPGSEDPGPSDYAVGGSPSGSWLSASA